MKAVILAGGFGSRLGDISKKIPKPMVRIGKKPIIAHIIDIYLKNGINEFYIALGYKSNVIRDYFSKNYKKTEINLISTGIKSMTGGRLKKMARFIKDETFLLTYGDGLSDVNIKKMIKFHKRNNKLVTVCAVRPPPRFGGLKIKGNTVTRFEEKKPMNEGWINGGFFIMEPKFLKYIKNDKTILERDPLEKITNLNQLQAYKHHGFWMCMDTKRDRDRLVELNKLKTKLW